MLSSNSRCSACRWLWLCRLAHFDPLVEGWPIIRGLFLKHWTEQANWAIQAVVKTPSSTYGPRPARAAAFRCDHAELLKKGCDAQIGGIDDMVFAYGEGERAAQTVQTLRGKGQA